MLNKSEFINNYIELGGHSEDICQNADLSKYSTMRCGGKAALLVSATSEENVSSLLKAAKLSGSDFYILGYGSNTMFSDKGYDGVVIFIGSDMKNPLFPEENIIVRSIDGDSEHLEVEALAGCRMARFGATCAKAGLTGAEFTCGIPGGIGGAVYMNAGAYGGQMQDFVTEVTYIDADGNIRKISGDKCEFGYRHSFFEKHGGVILSMKAKLAKGNREEIDGAIAEMRQKRINSQPLDVPSCGSTFKRPEGYFAGKLIQDADLKGFSLPGSMAQVSPKHAGFVVNNEGKATATEVYELIQYVIKKVYETSGVKMEPEIRLIGFEEEK